MRLALGSEKTVRQESKKTLEEARDKKHGKQATGSGLFENHSFQDFTHEKFKELLVDEKAATAFLSHIEKAIDEKKVNETSKLKADLNKNLISPRTFKQRQKELESWVTNERRELHYKKRQVVQTFEEVGSYITRLESEKKIMLEKIGSPGVPKRLLDSQSSLES